MELPCLRRRIAEIDYVLVTQPVEAPPQSPSVAQGTIPVPAVTRDAARIGPFKAKRYQLERILKSKYAESAELEAKILGLYSKVSQVSPNVQLFYYLASLALSL